MPTFTCPGGDSDGHDQFAAWVGGAITMFVNSTVAGRAAAGIRITGLPFANRSDGLLTPTTFDYTDQVITSFTLNLEHAAAALVASANPTISLFVVDQVNPPVFSTGAQMPTVLRAANLELARATITGAEIGGDPLVFTVPDNNNPNTTFRDVAALGIARLNRVYRRQGFQGAVAFVVDWTVTPTAGLDFVQLETVEGGNQVPNMVTVEFTEFTGIEGHVDAWSRVSRCPRCVKILPREQFVEDGFARGLLVCPKCYDPPDFHAEWGRRLVGREREGIND